MTNGLGYENLLELVVQVLRDSLKEANEDKNYFLSKLQDLNKAAETVSDYLDQLVQKSMELGEKERSKECPESLTDLIKRVERRQEEIRNTRQMAATAFQNFDQKSNQLFDLLASVIKTMNEMRAIGVSSRAGL